MKLDIEYSSEFNEDVKTLRKRGFDLTLLRETIELITQNETLPESYSKHQLKAEFKGYWECHILDDWLLIWKESKTTISFARTGTHADLF